MRLLKFFWAKKNNLLVIILTLVTIIFAVPIIKSGVSGVFYNMDPEMALVGNALSYINKHVIMYRDHPGTPIIMFIVNSYLPVRVYAKLILHTNFISWSFDNLRILFLYTRYSMIAVFLLSVFLYLTSVRKITNSLLGIIFSWLALFVFLFTLRLDGAVLSETFSFLFISLWLIIFTTHYKEVSLPKLFVMSLLAGLAVASKYNSFPIVLISLLLVFLVKGINFKQKINHFIVNGVFAISGFIIGTWEVRNSYLVIIKQMLKVVSQSGNEAAHAYGESSFFNLDSYISSLKSFFASQTVPALILLSIPIFLFFVFIFKKRKNYKIEYSVIIASFVTLFSVAFIAKYPLPYYQFPNYLLAVFLVSYFVSKLPKVVILISCLLIFPYTLKNIQNYNSYLNNLINNSVYLEKYIKENPSKIATLWDYGPTEDFMKIWTRSWGGGVYESFLNNKRPDLLELRSDYKSVYLSENTYKNVFDACWDKLYIRKERALVFLDMYGKRNLNYKTIGNTGIWEIVSNHCLTHKP